MPDLMDERWWRDPEHEAYVARLEAVYQAARTVVATHPTRLHFSPSIERLREALRAVEEGEPDA